MKTLFLHPLFLLFISLTFFSANCVAEVEEGKSALVIGRVSDNPQKHYKRLKPIVDYVVGHMQDLGITEGKVLMAKDNEQIIWFLKEGKVDWVTESFFSALIISKETDAEIILRRWKKNTPDYYTVFFTHKDEGIKTIADLKGKKIAFEDPGSTTSFFVPLLVLKRHGLSTVQLSSPRVSSPPDKVGYAFAGGEINVTMWVYKKLADAGAFSNLDWEDLDDAPKAFKDDLEILYATKPFPRAVELVRKGLNESVKERLRQILLNAHNDPEAKAVLKAYSKTKKFDMLDEEAMKDLDEARESLKYIESDLK